MKLFNSLGTILATGGATWAVAEYFTVYQELEQVLGYHVYNPWPLAVVVAGYIIHLIECHVSNKKK